MQDDSKTRITLLSLGALTVIGVFVSTVITLKAFHILDWNLRSANQDGSNVAMAGWCATIVMGALFFMYKNGHSWAVNVATLIFAPAIIFGLRSSDFDGMIPQASWLPVLLALMLTDIGWTLLTAGFTAALIVWRWGDVGAYHLPAPITTSLVMLMVLAASRIIQDISLRNERRLKNEAENAKLALQELNETLEARVAERTVTISNAMIASQEAATKMEIALSLVEATLEGTDNGILVVDRQGKITTFNKRFVSMWRIPDELIEAGDDRNVLGFALDQLIDPHEFLNKVEALYGKPEAVSRDTLHFSDGRVFARFSHPQRLHNEVVGRVWSFLDITEQIRSEERVIQLSNAITDELNQSESQRQQLQALLSAIPDLIWMKNSSGVFLSCNPAVEKLLGAPTAEIIGKTDHDFFPLEVVDAFQADDRIAAESVEPTVREEWVTFNSDGHQALLETVKAAVRTKDGALIGILGVARDVTQVRSLMADLEIANKEALQSNQAKSMFLANMSHEIRTPMNAIIGMTDLAMNTALNDRQKNYINKIKSASEALLHVINDILDFSKIDAGKLTMENNPFDLDDVFEQLSAVCSLTAESQGVELSYDISPEVPTAFVGDHLRLNQVLTNLLSNAIKFSAGGNVVVRVKEIPDTQAAMATLHFAVTDQGIGMTEEQISQIFKPFAQADSSTTRRFGGTGLGLAICQQLVELFGGRIWVESELDVGSTFHFTVRLLRREQRLRSGLAELAAKLADYAANPVLVVDDNPLAAKILERMLTELGLTVIVASSGLEALRKIQDNNSPDLLACLTDWSMPSMTGVDMIRQMRIILGAQGARIPPMILVTAHSQDEKLRNIAHEIDGLLAKPVSARHLYVELANCLGIPAPGHTPAEKKPASKLQWARFRKLDILVVEDVDINREVILALLGDVGLHARVATNGKEALMEIARKTPNIVLMDCQMPIMDGYEATRQLRSSKKWADLKIVALTANAMIEDRQKCIDAGMDDHLAKPIRMDALRECFGRLLSATEISDPVITDNESGDSECPLPDLPGIDASLGLEQVGGRRELYSRLLKRFRDTQCRFFESEFRSTLEQANAETATRLAHSIKGVANTLGAIHLGDLAAELEEAITCEDRALIDKRLDLLVSELNLIAAGLAELDQLFGGSPAPTIAVKIDESLLVNIDLLAERLRARDTAASDIAEVLNARLSGTQQQTAWVVVSTAIEDYDFDGALASLIPLRETLQSVLAKFTEPHK